MILPVGAVPLEIEPIKKKTTNEKLLEAESGVAWEFLRVKMVFKKHPSCFQQGDRNITIFKCAKASFCSPLTLKGNYCTNLVNQWEGKYLSPAPLSVLFNLKGESLKSHVKFSALSTQPQQRPETIMLGL